MAELLVQPLEQAMVGSISVPVSKYHLHRALIMGSLGQGPTRIHGSSGAMHIADTVSALTSLGIPVAPTADGYQVDGGAYLPPGQHVPVGSSGSTLQFLLGLGSRSAAGPVTFYGSPELTARPIGPLLAALSGLGIRHQSQGGRLPVTIYPGVPRGGAIHVSGFLSQWVSALLLLAPFAQDSLSVVVDPPHNERSYIRLTLDMLRSFGITVQEDWPHSEFFVPAGQRYLASAVDIQADLSSAAFPLAMAALHPSDVQFDGMSDAASHPEGRILDVLAAMGLTLRKDPLRRRLRVEHHGGTLRAISLDMADIPDLFPIVTVLASLAHGRTVLHGIDSIRYKESDRVAAMLQLGKMGARIEDRGGHVVIDGVSELHGAALDSCNDHRVLMAFTVAASRARGASTISHPYAYRISYPEFLDDMQRLGLRFEVVAGPTAVLPREGLRV